MSIKAELVFDGLSVKREKDQIELIFLRKGEDLLHWGPVEVPDGCALTVTGIQLRLRYELTQR